MVIQVDSHHNIEDSFRVDGIAESAGEQMYEEDSTEDGGITDPLDPTTTDSDDMLAYNPDHRGVPKPMNPQWGRTVYGKPTRPRSPLRHRNIRGNNR